MRAGEETFSPAGAWWGVQVDWSAEGMDRDQSWSMRGPRNAKGRIQQLGNMEGPGCTVNEQWGVKLWPKKR